MKQYGAKKATEFTRKQINVLWVKAKNEQLKIEKWFIKELYDLADYYGFDDNGSVARCEQAIEGILRAVFAGDLSTAQDKINILTESIFTSYTAKVRAKFDRALVA